MTVPNIVVIPGSTRQQSLNHRLAVAVSAMLNHQQVSARCVTLKDYPLPIYQGDLEQDSFPSEARALKAELATTDGYVFCCPEYNSSIAPLLKNTIDWLSRDGQGGGDLSLFADKSALLLAASPGGLGGLRGLAVVRSLLSNIGVHVFPEQFALGQAHEKLSTANTLVDAQSQAHLKQLLQRFALFCCKQTCELSA